MFQIGDRFGDYEVVKILGAGGMGQVYKVRNTLSDRFEAMKVLLPNLQQHADLADRFLREIKVQAALQHKNIAGLHTAQRHEDRILMFIEFVDGMTLDKALDRGPLSPELAANIIGQVLEALAYAHSRGVVHRDIKPENIMVQPDGVVKLMDFGIARLAQDKRLTSTGRTVGSLYYMSPEQIRGADDLDGRSDLYSLGITLYQCVTGKRPFDGDSDYSIMAAHIQQNPVHPIVLDPQVPAALNDVIMMAISKDRAQRFQTAEAFRAALLGSVSPGAVAGATMPMASAAPAPQQPLPPPPPPPPAPTPTVVTAPPKPTQVMQPPVAPPPPAMMQKPGGASSKGLWIGVAVLAVAAVGGVGVIKGPEWFGNRVAAEPAKNEPATPPGNSGPQDSTPTSGTAATTPSASTTPSPGTQAPTAGSSPSMPSVTPTRPPAVQQAPQQQPQTATPQQQQQTYSPPPTQQQQQPSGSQTAPPRNTYQVEQSPAQQPQKGPDPQVARELEELRQEFNSLSTRFAGVQESYRRLEMQQQRQGFGMRRDMRDAVNRFQYLMKESSDSLMSRNVDSARTSLQMAERTLERIEKFLGN